MMSRIIFLLLLLFTAACQSFSSPTPTPTATNISTMTASPSPTQVPPTATATLSPTSTNTPTVTPTLTQSPQPSITPQPTAGFTFDHSRIIEVPGTLRDGLIGPMIAFINQNDRDGIGDVRTPQPATNVQTLYYVSPSSPAGQIPILQMPANVGTQIFIAPPGNAIAYFLDAPNATGLYLVDLSRTYSGRVLLIPSLTQRGFLTTPSWSPDGLHLAIALSTGYDMDVFTMTVDGPQWRNATQHGAFDLWPAWSPDGRFLLFVSDRARCSSWIPEDVEACDPATTPYPNGGNLFIMEVATETVTQVSDQWVTEPPRWLNERQVVFTSGDPALGDPERTLWIADVATGVSREARLADGSDNPIRLSEEWSPDGRVVLFQSAGATNEIILMTDDGALVGRDSALTFPRYGMSAAWSPDAQRVAIGGVNNQCPHGVSVFDRNFNVIARGNPPPSMCDPVFSPDGSMLAFTGVNPRIDGRVDVYVANSNGFGAVNLTTGLRGQIHLLGWVGR